MEKHFSEYDKALYRDGFKLGIQITDPTNEEELFSAIKTMFNSIDQLLESLLALANREGLQVACKKGCSYCCQQAVYANSYEIHYLGNHIKTHCSNEMQKDIIENASQKSRHVKKLTDSEILNYKHACPLLKNGVCKAYEARPMACRIYLSQNLSSCVEFYNNPENPNNYPALLEFPLRAGRMMNEGFMAALKENGIETTEFRLEEGLLSFFNQNE